MQDNNRGECEENEVDDLDSEEFEDAFDNEKDLNYYNSKLTVLVEEELPKSHSLVGNELLTVGERSNGLRRTASLSNIIQEDAEGEDDQYYSKNEQKEETKKMLSKFSTNYKNSNEKCVKNLLGMSQINLKKSF